MLWVQQLVYMIYVNHVIKQANIVLDHSNESIDEFVKRLKDQNIIRYIYMIKMMQ